MGLLQEKSEWETQLDTVAARETCSRVASRSLGWSTSPPISRCTRLETLLTSRDVVLSRRVCPRAYHGKTGRVFNVSKRAVGVVVNKRVGGKILPKRICVRVEHVKHSQCRKDFLDRVHANEVKKKEAKTTGKKGAPCKRLPQAPKEAHLVSTKDNEPQVLGPIPFEFMA